MSEEIKDIVLDIKDSLNETPKNMYKYNKITLNLDEFEEILNYIEQLENIRKETIEYMEQVIHSNSSTKLPSGKITDIGYCIVAFEDLLNKLNKGE